MALLNLIQTEFLKLRRKKMIWVMLLVALIMPFLLICISVILGKRMLTRWRFINGLPLELHYLYSYLLYWERFALL